MKRQQIKCQQVIVCLVVLWFLATQNPCVSANGELFPTNLPKSQWAQFDAQGFSHPVVGALYDLNHAPCCGMPLGGMGTGCIDIDTSGTYGMSTIFSDFTLHGAAPWVGLTRGVPRMPALYRPFLGLAVGQKTWVMASPNIIKGGTIQGCTEPLLEKADWQVNVPNLGEVEPAQQIHYWGHYPVVDIEYDTNAPVQVGLRAWSPFIPGDANMSNIPAAVFEVHLRNSTSQSQKGTLAFNFPGPLEHESRGASNFRRSDINEPTLRGILVEAVTPDPAMKVQYFMGLIGNLNPVEFGGGLTKGRSNINALGVLPTGWEVVGKQLWKPGFNNATGESVSLEAGTSAAVKFELGAKDEKVIRFVLAWYAPSWYGLDTKKYTHRYSARFAGALDVARTMTVNHEKLLRRVLAWQAVIYDSNELPLWLRDTLINSLALIPEDSFWLQPNPPLEWSASDGGFFGLLESPRMCPQIECIPCSWYGNQPVVYFFPELALNTLRSYKRLITDKGDSPFTMSGAGPGRPHFKEGYGWQTTLNGTCYVDLVDRVWRRTGDDKIVKEFYETVKRATEFTMNLRPGPDGVISMPAGNQGMEWFEVGKWAGMCAHLGGLHLAQLRIAERMAHAVGDTEFEQQCQRWFKSGSASMEEKMWTGRYYLNCWEPESGLKSDVIMAYQLDGEWAADFHGVAGVFRKERIQQALQSIRQGNVAHAICGAVNFVKPDGSLVDSNDPIAGYGVYHMFPPEVLVLAMTYIYEGNREFGIDLARRSLENIVCRNRYPWDQPNGVRGDTGERVAGTDYYQNMMLWSLPAALAGKDLAEPCRAKGIVDRILHATQSPLEN